jgi:NhaA family Na+:H+ antiporter
LAFAENDASGGILLLVCTVFALIWANSPWYGSYESILHTIVTVGAGGFQFNISIHHLINDGLMAIFFFLVGLEIKREMLAGELASAKQAALPIAAATGGVLFPALIYFFVNFFINPGSGSVHGWAIPMATDIAFAVGVMALLRDRVPPSLKVFLTALAIVDDIAAVLVIALFYTKEISIGSIGVAGVCLAISYAANRLGMRSRLPYTLLGILVWLALLRSGIHATIAGVLLAFTIPVKTKLDPAKFLSGARNALHHFEAAASSGMGVLSSEEQQAAIRRLEVHCEHVQPPLHRMELALRPWVSLVIMPVFALANAGVRIVGSGEISLFHPVLIGVAIGLLVGKPAGVTLFAWLAVRFGLAERPASVSWKQLHGASWLAGIGFTMSLFIATLAFQGSPMLVEAKIGILLGSLAAGIVGSVGLWCLSAKNAGKLD